MATRNAVSKFDESSWRVDSVTGDLHVPVTPTRPGVYLYKNPQTGKIQRELRSDYEVYRADSLQTLEGKPFTNDHPKDANGKFMFLTPETTPEHKKGLFVGSHTISTDGIHTQGMVIVTDPAQIDLIKAGKQAVSCGYKCDEDYTPGVDPKYGPYDMAQKNLNYNHLANVYRGRMGEGARLRMDSDDLTGCRFDAEEIDPEELEEAKEEVQEAGQILTGMAMMSDQNAMSMKMLEMGSMAEKTVNKDKRKEKRKRMAVLKTDHGEFEIDNELKLVLDIQTGEAQKKFDGEKLRADTAETELKTEKARAERLDAELAVSKRELLVFQQAQQAEARKGLETSAKKIMGDGAKFDGLTDREVKEQVIEKALPWAKEEKALGERTDEWIDTMLSVAQRESAKPAPVAPTPGFQALIQKSVEDKGNRADGAEDLTDPAAARAKMMADIQNAHKN